MSMTNQEAAEILGRRLFVQRFTASPDYDPHATYDDVGEHAFESEAEVDEHNAWLDETEEGVPRWQRDLARAQREVEASEMAIRALGVDPDAAIDGALARR
jgi:hypothetical protein